MKKIIILLVLMTFNLELKAQSIAINGNQYHYYGPNTNWGEYLKVGGNGRETTNASVVTTNGNLHLDSKDGFATYINYYSKGNTYINSQGGLIGIGTANPDVNSGMHMFGNRYTLYGPNTSWGQFLIVGGNGRETTNASVVTTNGNLHLDSKDGFSTYINHYSKGNTYINPQGGNVSIGTTDSKGYKLAIAGKVVAEEIKVALQSNWPDYVFDKNYTLPTLEEVEKHILKEGHLKDIPSAKEVLNNGYYLGEMDSKLLLKIEELTIYTINQQKEIEKLKKENEILHLFAERLKKIEKLIESKKLNGL